MLELDTISKPSARRGLDLPVTFCAQLTDGDRIRVLSLRSDFIWSAGYPSGTSTDNQSSFRPTSWVVNGAFIRDPIPDPSWTLLQTNWVLDDQNSTGLMNIENGGSTASDPITCSEFMYRTGQLAQWLLTEYHIRVLSDSEFLEIGGDLRNATIFVHGSMTNGQGKTQLASLVMDSGTFVAQVQATNTPYQVGSSTITTSWTADGLLGKRCRRLNSTAVKFWPVKDLTSKTARMSDTIAAATYTAPFAVPSTSPTIAANDTYVVEDLTQIRRLLLTARRKGTGAVFTGSIVLESLKTGRRDASSGTTGVSTDANIIFDGCEVWELSSGQSGGLPTLQMLGCKITSIGSIFSMSPVALLSVRAGYTDKVMILNTITNVQNSVMANNFMVQAGRLYFQNCPLNVTDVAVFDAAIGIEIERCDVRSIGKVWGSGNTSLFYLVAPSAILSFSNVAQLSGWTATATNGIVFEVAGAVVTQGYAFDPAASPPGYTALRTMSITNLAAALGSGGFNGFIIDPQSGCRVCPA